jgi:hypothetical protein
MVVDIEIKSENYDYTMQIQKEFEEDEDWPSSSKDYVWIQGQIVGESEIIKIPYQTPTKDIGDYFNTCCSSGCSLEMGGMIFQCRWGYYDGKNLIFAVNSYESGRG